MKNKFRTICQKTWKGLKRTKYFQLMILPVIIYYIIFYYVPMYGVLIAFKDFNMRLGILGSPWIGFENFTRFLNHPYVWKLVRNTLILNFYSLIFGFPAPIILALMLNEVRNQRYKKIVQTISYLPHFLSTVAVIGLLTMLLSPSSGFVNAILKRLGMDPIFFMVESRWFRPLYILSGIWQGVGWGSILYLAALTSIDPQLYEAATIDGASRMRQIWHISLSGIKSTIVILLILRMGRMLSSDSEKILLMYSPLTYEVADVISTFIHRKGLLEAQYSYGAAVGLLNSAVSLTILFGANRLSKVVTDDSLW